jgi:RecB family exonuclease
VHNALAGFWRLARRDRTVAAAGDLLDQGWLSDGFAGPAQSEAHRQRCRRMVESYVSRLDPAVEPVGVERTVATRTDAIAVSGRIDRLDDRRAASGGTAAAAAGDLVVVDYKTGRHRLTVDDARTSLTLALYALGAERVLRRPCRRVELHHVPTGEVLAAELTADSLARQLRRAEDIAAECAAADEQYQALTETAAAAGPAADRVFPPRPGPSCGWCDYRASCPEGSAAGARRRPWDGLEDDDQPAPGGVEAAVAVGKFQP